MAGALRRQWKGRGATTHRSVVLRVGEQNNPFVANELVELDGAVCGFGFEVGGDATETEGC